MATIRFTYLGPQNGYVCNQPGDNSGDYVNLNEYEKLQAELEQLQRAYKDVLKIQARLNSELSALQRSGVEGL